MSSAKPAGQSSPAATEGGAELPMSAPICRAPTIVDFIRCLDGDCCFCDNPARSRKAMAEWKPIETAPKKGWFWLWLGWRGACLGRRSLDSSYQWEFIEHEKQSGNISYFMNAINGEATKWMPLPDPPEPGEASEAQAPDGEKAVRSERDELRSQVQRAQESEDKYRIAWSNINGQLLQERELADSLAAALKNIKAECYTNLDCNHQEQDSKIDPSECEDIDDCIGCTLAQLCEAALAEHAARRGK